MQKPRPKEAPAPRQQRSARENRGSNKGAEAPFVIPEGEKVPENQAKPTGNGVPQRAEEDREKAGTDPAVIVFGHNGQRVPQAAWFPEAEADPAIRAARLMGLRVLRIEDEPHRELAERLCQGQVYAADRTFAPAVLPDIFSALCKLAEPVATPSPAEVMTGKDAAASRPTSWQAIEVGSLVIAHESHQDGWWRRSSWQSRTTSWSYAGATTPGNRACAGAASMSRYCRR